MDNALSFQKKRNETTGLGGVPAGRASCFVASLPFGALDDRSMPAVQPGYVSAGANAGGSLFAGYFTDFDTGGNSRRAGLAVRIRGGAQGASLFVTSM
ncbi:hypothetical protein [Paraburkholderia sp. SIMBA_030]|uniref:hypothetical protein n=1 Tax=Paraburkholderia sp. SIMBA_030 TaxID=3085773 RepID=UPI0039795DCA